MRRRVTLFAYGIIAVNCGLSINFVPAMFDMLGNVWEWTSAKYFERVIDRKLQDTRYVLKGGSYIDSRDGTYNYAVRTSNR